jgi:AcrR family transcriptional regulator
VGLARNIKLPSASQLARKRLPRKAPAASVSRRRMTGPERREQLVGVGRVQVFAEKGYEATSVEEIADRANVSKPVVYEHFGGKEGCTRSSSTGRLPS